MPTITARRTSSRTTRSSRTFTGYRPQVRSRHPTHAILRTELEKLPFKSIVRLGSVTDLPDTITNGGRRVECNTIEGITNTSNKIKMKRLFKEANIKSPKFILGEAGITSSDIENQLEYPIIAKIKNHSRGRGMIKISNSTELNSFLSQYSLTMSNYILEQFVNYHKEYRIHCDNSGIFYACRKLRKNETPEGQRWYFNSENCNFQIVTMASSPSCWPEIELELVKALKSLKMDIGGFDVRVNREGTKFTIIELNSACSLHEVGHSHYLRQIPLILKRKATEAGII